MKWMINYLNGPSGVKLMGVDGGVIGQLLYFGGDALRGGGKQWWREDGGRVTRWKEE